MEKKLLLNLQMFANGEEEQTETPTEEVENSQEDVDTLDEENEIAEFDDGEEEQEEKKTTAKSTREQNYKNAQARIQRKKQEEQEKIEKEAYRKGVIKATNGVNKYTNKPIVDSEDIALYEMMCEIDADGGDPIEDFADYWKEKQKNERIAREKELEEKNKNDQKINDDLNAFINKYPDVNLNELLDGNNQNERANEEHKSFIEMFGDLVGEVPLTTLYEKYKSIQNIIDTNINNKVKDKIIRQKALEMSSTGPLGNNSTQNTADFASMSREEFAQWKQKNIRR